MRNTSLIRKMCGRWQRFEFSSFLFLILSSALNHDLPAQEKAWSFSGSAGYAILSMAGVNQTLDRTVENWNNDFNIPIGPIGHFNSSPVFSARAAYRFDRDAAVSLSVFNFSRSVSDSYVDTTSFLSLERSVGSTDIAVGITYYFQPLRYGIELYALFEYGLIFARADANTYATQTSKSGGVTTTQVLFDTKAVYRKSTGVLNVGAGAVVSVLDPLLIRLEAAYRLASVGTMDGEVQSAQGTSTQTSVTDFNFSSFVVSLGIGIQF